MDNTNLDERLITQANKAAELIKDDISIQLYEKLCGTIVMCQNYVQGADGLGCKAQNDYFPEDLELVIEDKMPDFVSFLDENLTSKEDFQKAMDFVNEKMCY